MGTRTGNSFYLRTPLWQRMLRSLALAVVSLFLFLLVAFVNGWFFDSEASAENLILFVSLCAATSALVFLAAIVMFEFWWKRHPPAWMVEDDDDGAPREPDQRG